MRCILYTPGSNNQLENQPKNQLDTQPDTQLETDPVTQPEPEKQTPNNDGNSVSAPIRQDDGAESPQPNPNECSPNIYGPKSFFMCNSIKRADNVERVPNSPLFTLYDPYLCKF